MKLTVLTDNNVLQSKNFLGEHGLSFYIESGNKKILFDTGYSDVFIKNACKMGINLLDLDYIVLSHGHYDHTWGLSYYLPFYAASLKQGVCVKKPTILTHPESFDQKSDEKTGELGMLVPEEKLKKNFDIKLTREPFWLTENLIFLGEIPRKNNFEGKECLGKVLKNNKLQDDFINEDSALVFNSNDGIVIITGCSHSGICNIIEYSKNICNNSSIIDIIGGFHLLSPSENRAISTAEYMSKQNIDTIYPCHCTNLQSKIILSKYLNVKELGVGLTLEYMDK